MTTAADLTFHTPDCNRGQAVRVSYALDSELGIVRRTQRPDEPTTYEVCTWDDWYDDNDDWPPQPWNDAPDVPEDLYNRIRL